MLHSRWEPADSFGGQVFREPLYTPRAAMFIAMSAAIPACGSPIRTAPVRKVAVRKSTTNRTGACVTELGYGRYHLCP